LRDTSIQESLARSRKVKPIPPQLTPQEEDEVSSARYDMTRVNSNKGRFRSFTRSKKHFEIAVSLPRLLGNRSRHRISCDYGLASG
jgi:hypothetical protein